MTSRCVTSILQFQSFCLIHKIPCTFDIMGNESLITRGRSILAQRFLQGSCTHLLFIDSDISFNPVNVLRMMVFDADVTAGIYAKKGLSWTDISTTTSVTPEGLRDAGLNFNINLPRGETNHTVTNGFLRVYDAATGFFLIKRETLKKLRDLAPDIKVVNDIPGSKASVPEYYVFFDTSIDDETSRYLSEDYHFCRMVQKHGMDVYVDITATVSHTGSLQYEGDMSDRMSVHLA